MDESQYQKFTQYEDAPEEPTTVDETRMDETPINYSEKSTNVIRHFNGKDAETTDATKTITLSQPRNLKTLSEMEDSEIIKMIKKIHHPQKTESPPEVSTPIMFADGPPPTTMPMSKRNEELFKMFVDRQNMGREIHSHHYRAWGMY